MTILIPLAFTLLLYGIAFSANARLHAERQLPMQWWITGAVTWSAPPRIALALIPAQGTAMLASIAVLSLTVPSRVGQEATVLPVQIVIGLTLVALQRLHLWLIDRTRQLQGT